MRQLPSHRVGRDELVVELAGHLLKQQIVDLKASKPGAGRFAKLVTVDISPLLKQRKKREIMQCVRQSVEVDVPETIARFVVGTTSYGQVPLELACRVQAGFAPKQ